MRTQKTVLGIVCRPEGESHEFLLVKSNDSWKLVGGAVLPGEEEPKAMIRELDEGIGLDSSEINVIEATGLKQEFEKGSVEINSFSFLIEAKEDFEVEVNKDQAGREYEDYEWVEPEEVTEYLEDEKEEELFAKVLQEFQSSE